MRFLKECRADATADLVYRGGHRKALFVILSRQGIYANTGSACASKALKTSPVLTALGLAPDVAQGEVVITFSQDNQDEDVQQVLEQLPPAVDRLRSFSPVWRKKWPRPRGHKEEKDETFHQK